MIAFRQNGGKKAASHGESGSGGIEESCPDIATNG